MTTAERLLTGPRWSSAVRCARQTVYQGLNAPEEPPPEDVQLRWRRGSILGAAAAEHIRREYIRRGGMPRAEEEIPWPAADPVGVGHADLYIPAERHIIEIVTTKDAALPEAKPLQVSGYVINHPKAIQGTVLSIDPNTSEERSYPIDVEGLSGAVARIEDQVMRGIRSGGDLLPERAGRHPMDWPCRECPFATTVCYQDWDEPPLVELPGVQADIERLADLDDLLAESKDPVLEEERKALRDRLAPMVEPGKDYMAGNIRFRRTPVDGRRSLDLSSMEKAGYSLPRDAEEFVRTGKGYDRWTVRRLPT